MGVLGLALIGCAAPQLVVNGPQETVTGPFEVTVRTEGSWVEMSVDGGAAIPVQDGTAAIDPASWEDGSHTVAVRAGGFLRTTAQEELRVEADVHGPEIRVASQSRTVEQGHTLAVFFETDEATASRTVRFLDRERPVFPVGENRWRALIGVPIRTEAVEHALAIEATDVHGNATTVGVPVAVSPVEWVISGKLPLSKKKARVQPEGVLKMRAERDAVYAGVTATAAWSEVFAMPLEGKHTSAFGTFREYPDGKRSHHDAEDIGQEPGTPILAAGPGVVALARSQEVHGNAVLVDHGQKVITLYSHMQRFAVEEGQAVQPGDVLGYVGSTGRSTGPHLHWGVVVDEVPVDPMQWLEQAFVEPGEMEATGG